MPAVKRNEWLDAGDSQDEDEGAYDSDAVEDSRVARASKRRRVSAPDDDASSVGEEQFEDDEEVPGLEDASGQEEPDAALSLDVKAKKALSKPKITKALLKMKDTSSKTGVIYLSRVPPFMKPLTVKSLLSGFGNVGRIFLTPEDPTSHSRRVKSGGNKKRSFTDGWVEFLRKKDAKLVAETLNAQIIGGKKGGWYHDDVWNIKYLKGFKWHHLTEQIANENAERAARMRTEIAQTTRENKRFIANVERAKMLEGMESKKRKKAEVEGSRPEVAQVVQQPAKDSSKDVRRNFRQNEVKVQDKTSGLKEQPEEVRRVLSKIF